MEVRSDRHRQLGRVAARAASAILLAACAGTPAGPESSVSPLGTPGPPPSPTALSSPTALPSRTPNPTSAPSPSPSQTPNPIYSAPVRPTPAPSPIRITFEDLWSGGWRRYGPTTLQVDGWLAIPWGVGGTNTGITPAWLGEWLTDEALWETPGTIPRDCSEDACRFVFLHPAPGTSLGRLDRWVRATGHFDDPRAATCRPTLVGMTVAEAVRTCRDRFVVTTAVSLRRGPER